MRKLEKKQILWIDDEFHLSDDGITQMEYDGAIVTPIGTADAALGLYEKISRGEISLGTYDVVIIDMAIDSPNNPPLWLHRKNDVGGFLLYETRQMDLGYLPVVIYSQLALHEIVIPAWDAYRRFVEGRDLPCAVPEDLQGQIDVLESKFKTFAWLKGAITAKQLPQKIEELLGRRGIKGRMF